MATYNNNEIETYSSEFEKGKCDILIIPNMIDKCVKISLTPIIIK